MVMVAERAVAQCEPSVCRGNDLVLIDRSHYRAPPADLLRVADLPLYRARRDAESLLHLPRLVVQLVP